LTYLNIAYYIECIGNDKEFNMASVAQSETLFAMGSATAPKVALIGSLTALVLLAALHAVSPEFDPSWRMVSEYALGRYSWLLSAMFLCWALSSWALVAALRPAAGSWIGKAGLALLAISGLGEAMAAYYDVTAETMHGVAAALGIPTLPIAALLIGVALDRAAGRGDEGRPAMRLMGHLTWISFLLVGGSMALFLSTYAAAGGDPTAGPPTSLPEGTVALNGWANRLLILCYCGWLAATARRLMKLADAA
jgi:hypothetical protein